MNAELDNLAILVFEQDGLLIPHKRNPRVTDSDLSLDLSAGNMFLHDTSIEPYRVDAFTVAYDGPSRHSSITEAFDRSIRDLFLKEQGEYLSCDANDYLKDLYFSSNSDANGVRQDAFQPKGTRVNKAVSIKTFERNMKQYEDSPYSGATTLFTPYFPDNVTLGLHTKVYLSKRDLECFKLE